MHYSRNDLIIKESFNPEKSGIFFGLTTQEFNETRISKNSKMKSTSVITVIESSTLFNEKMLEDFVTRNLLSIAGSPDDSLPLNFSTIVWASVNMPVMGSLELIFEDKDYENIERVNIPVDSLFFITCTKDKTGTCKVAWSNSLS